MSVSLSYCQEVCELGFCASCGLCCQECACELELEDDEPLAEWDLSDMEDERYFWDR